MQNLVHGAAGHVVLAWRYLGQQGILPVFVHGAQVCAQSDALAAFHHFRGPFEAKDGGLAELPRQRSQTRSLKTALRHNPGGAVNERTPDVVVVRHHKNTACREPACVFPAACHPGGAGYAARIDRKSPLQQQGIVQRPRWLRQGRLRQGGLFLLRQRHGPRHEHKNLAFGVACPGEHLWPSGRFFHREGKLCGAYGGGIVQHRALGFIRTAVCHRVRHRARNTYGVNRHGGIFHLLRQTRTTVDMHIFAVRGQWRG